MNERFFDFYGALALAESALKKKRMPAREAEQLAARVVSGKRRLESLRREVEALLVELQESNSATSEK